MSDKKLNSDNVDPNTNNSLHEFSEFSIIQYFNKMNIKEIEPTTKNINEYIFVSIVVDELVNLVFKELNKGRGRERIKQHVLNYINNHVTISQEIIYNWLLNNQNNSNSIYLFGYFNYYGIETDLNEQKAFELYQKAADLENVVAQIGLVHLYIHGKDVERNYNKAFELSKKLAEEGIPNAINWLGLCFEIGMGTDSNMQKAFELYQKAADLGNWTAISNLGWCYDKGIGTDINKQKAFELYQEASNFGNTFAQYNFALMYENGDGIKKDIDKAIYWYKKSAEQGDKEAQDKLNELLKK